jgi:hypothetical protein
MFEQPPNYPIYTKYVVTVTLQMFYTFNYFTLDLSDGETCLLASGLRPMMLLRPSASAMPTLSSLGR